MPPADSATLGLASIDRLRELRQASERQRATEGRQVQDLPLEEIHPDPDQVRRDFSGEVVDSGDEEELRGLAQSIAALGVQSPIRVRRDPEGGYRIVYGERRFRAARLAGLETVPCLVQSDEGFGPGRNTLAQLAENLQRQDLRLVDLVHAVARCLEETGLPAGQLARELGKSKSWISKHLALRKAEGAFAAALAEGWLGNVEAARMFGGLSGPDQERLLARARRYQAPIPHGELARLARGKGSAEASPAAPSARDGAARDGESVYVLHLTTAQLLELVRRLGGDGSVEPRIETVYALLEAAPAD